MNARGILERFFPAELRERVSAFGVRVVELKKGERYADLSSELSRMHIDVEDAWPAPPAGLFVVAERAVYVREVTPMTVAHEYGHAIDCMLGEGVYASSIDEGLRAEFNGARGYVSPYAATAVDEWFAEGVRAFVGANDAWSTWPRVSRAKLRDVAPKLEEYLARVFTGGAA